MACVPYASVIGVLIYEMVCTRIDISHAVGLLSRYMLTPIKEHWTTVNRVFKYLHGMKIYDVCYQGIPGGDSGKLNVHGFVNADWDGDLDQ
jgi:hypothetical protein